MHDAFQLGALPRSAFQLQLLFASHKHPVVLGHMARDVTAAAAAAAHASTPKNVSLSFIGTMCRFTACNCEEPVMGSHAVAPTRLSQTSGNFWARGTCCDSSSSSSTYIYTWKDILSLPFIFIMCHIAVAWQGLSRHRQLHRCPGSQQVRNQPVTCIPFSVQESNIHGMLSLLNVRILHRRRLHQCPGSQQVCSQRLVNNLLSLLLLVTADHRTCLPAPADASLATACVTALHATP
jgi:hypothetical protein